MRLSIKKFALTCGIIWSMAVLIVSSANFIWPGYGTVFLTVIASVYPGYEVTHGMSSIIIGTLYALVDATVGGGVFAWLYNLIPD